MSCPELEKEILDAQDSIRETNAKYISYKHGWSGLTPDDVRDRMVHQLGCTPEAADLALNTATAHEPDMMKAVDYGETEAINLKSTKDQAYGKTGLSWQWLGDQAGKLREAFYNSVDRSFNASFKGWNDKLKTMVKAFAGDREILDLGKGVYAGKMAGRIIAGEVKNLHSLFKEQTGSDLSFKDFDEGLDTLAKTRGQNVEEFISKKKTEALSKMENKPVLKQLVRKLDLAQDLYRSQGVKDYLKNAYNKLDIARESMKLGDRGKDNYFHNRIVMEQHQDFWDSMFNPAKKTESSIGESKKYENGIDAEMAGFRPSSDSFTENEAKYWSSVANRIRRDRFSSMVRENAKLSRADTNKAMIETSADAAESAFEVRPENAKGWEVPRSADDRPYREMSNLGPEFDGIYAHPDVYQWQERVFRNVNTDGIVGKTVRGMNIWRNITLSLGAFPHAYSLGKKVFDISASIGVKDQLPQNMLGLVGLPKEGVSTLRQDSPKFAPTLRWIRNGLALDTVDMTKNAAFNRRYNPVTGDQTLGSLVKETLQGASNRQHEWLFDHVRTGIKLAMAHRIQGSDYFKDLVKQNGGDVDKSMEVVAKQLNDHFGGQNLEMIGRSRLAQSLLQATLMSPEWTEAKMKRAFGAVADINPEIRKRYQYSLAAEVFTMFAMRTGLQQIASAYTGNQRTWDEQKQDIWDGKFASIYLGKTREAKPHELFANLGISENQDWRLLLLPWKAMYDSGIPGTESYDPAALFREPVKEMGHKLNPAMKAAVEAMAGSPFNKNKPTGASGALTPLLPIGAQQGVEAIQKGAMSPTQAALATASGSVGLPVERYAINKEKKKDKTLRLVK